MKWFICLPVWLTALAGCALMVPPEEDPVYLKLTEVDNRLVRVERLIDNEGLMTLIKRLEATERDLQALRNDIETLQYDVEQSGGRQRELYLDLDQRLQTIEQSGLTEPRPAAGSRWHRPGELSGGF
jgi:hypothetical protein